MKITIVDVAKACNVSVATVSRVINGNYPVKKETKENSFGTRRLLASYVNLRVLGYRAHSTLFGDRTSPPDGGGDAAQCCTISWP